MLFITTFLTKPHSTSFAITNLAEQSRKQAAVSPSFDLIGHVEKAGATYPYYEIIVKDNYLIASDSFELDVLDVSNPANPNIPLSEFTDFIGSLALSGNELYSSYAGFSAIFSVLNVSTPTSPSVITTLNQTTTGWGNHGDIVVHGNYLYGINEDSPLLEVISIANPAIPTLVTDLDLPLTGTSMAIEGSSLYISASGNYLIIIDITNPVSPQIIGTYLVGVTASDGFVVQDNIAYLVGKKVGIYDVSDPLNPAELYLYDINGLESSYKGAALHENYLITYEYNGFFSDRTLRLIALDISNPQAPFEATAYPFDNTVFNNGLVYTIAINGEYVYVGTKGLYVLRFLEGSHTNTNIYLPLIQR